jgi:hypothetical protein
LNFNYLFLRFYGGIFSLATDEIVCLFRALAKKERPLGKVAKLPNILWASA